MATKQNAPSILQNRGPGNRAMLHEKTVAKNVKGTLKRIWGYLGRDKAAIIGIMILVLLTTVGGLAGPYLMANAIDQYIKVGLTDGFMLLLGLMAGIYVITAVTTYFQRYITIGIAQKTVKHMRQDLFSRLMTYELKFFDQTPTGDLMSRLTNDMENVNNTLAQGITDFLTSIMSIVSIAVMMFILNWRLAIVTIVTIPLIMIVAKTIAKLTRAHYRNQQKLLGQLNGVTEESLSGQKVIKLYGKEAGAIEEFGDLNRKLKIASIKAETTGGFMGPSMNIVNNLRFAVVAGFGGYLAVNGLVTVGIIAAFLNYSKNFGRPVSQLAKIYNMIQSAIAGAERVFETMDKEPEIIDEENACEMENIKGDVEFKDVSFGYNRQVQVLKEANLVANQGDTIAIVGPTGAGKTTIINLLTRFYDVEHGTITIDGVNIHHIKKDVLRQSLGIVLQDTYLFSETVRENIRYGHLDATDDQVEEAAKLAYAHHFIRHLPEGYDTILSEDGSNLSQGQRQLIAIARAILSDPVILILDEATSSVDTRTELYIQKAMLRLMEGRTSFVIAHRLSTIKDATSIIVLEDGRIIEQGSHQALLDAEGAYYHMHHQQYRHLS